MVSDTAIVAGGQPDLDLARLSVLDGVVHGFLAMWYRCVATLTS